MAHTDYESVCVFPHNKSHADEENGNEEDDKRSEHEKKYNQ